MNFIFSLPIPPQTTNNSAVYSKCLQIIINSVVNGKASWTKRAQKIFHKSTLHIDIVNFQR